MLRSPLKQKGSLTLQEMRLRLSPLKADSSTAKDPFGHLEESDTEEASMYQEPVRLDDKEDFRKLVKNYSCGRLCDYDDFASLDPCTSNKFGSTPLFNLPTSERTKRKPTTSKSFTNNLYEKDYRKPCFEPGYSVPVTRSRQSLARALSVQEPVQETFYAATDIIQVSFSSILYLLQNISSYDLQIARALILVQFLYV